MNELPLAPTRVTWSQAGLGALWRISWVKALDEIHQRVNDIAGR